MAFVTVTVGDMWRLKLKPCWLPSVKTALLISDPVVHQMAVVLYKCETWSLRVFENRVLRKIFGPKRDEVTGEWRKLLNEELRDLYSSPSIIRIIKLRRIRWAGHVARMG
jgi:hypothetical protein